MKELTKWQAVRVRAAVTLLDVFLVVGVDEEVRKEVGKIKVMGSTVQDLGDVMVVVGRLNLFGRIVLPETAFAIMEVQRRIDEVVDEVEFGGRLP